MVTRFKWLISGALLTVLGISYVTYTVDARRDAARALEAENIRLAAEAEQIAA